MSDPAARPKGVAAALGGTVALAACVVAAILAIATGREVSIGRQEVAAADEAASRLDWPAAILHARAAAEAYVPGSPWPSRGEERLMTIAHRAETGADTDTALLAYGAVRTAAIATRSWDSRRWRLDAEAGLARVAAVALSSGPPASARDAAAPRTMLEALRRDDTPAAGAFAALSAAVLAIIGGAAGLVFAAGGRGPVRLAQSLVAAGLLTYAAVLLTN